jgi:hypothetical protein
MTKTFKKGDTVLVISLWSGFRINYTTGAVESRIQYYIQRATVMAAGKKQMHLNDATTGVFLGSNFAPAMSQSARFRTSGDFSQMLVVPATLTDEEAVELARRATKAYQANEVALYCARRDIKENDRHANYLMAHTYAMASTPVLEPIWKVAKDYNATEVAA